jgi:hypothetical protein
MFLRVDPQADAVAPLNHCAVTTHVDPTLLGIAHHHHVLRADVAPAVAGMPARRGKAFDIDVIVLLHVFQDRPILYDFRSDRHGARALVAPAAQQLQWMNVDGQIHRQGKAAKRPVRVGADSVSRRITGEFIENKHRATALRRQLSESADVKLQVSSFDILHFADGIRRFDKVA